MTRPNPVRWLFCQFGGRLPDRYRDWVRHDATCRTWLVRKLFRTLIVLAPVFAVLVVVLGMVSGLWPLAAGSVLLGVLVALRISLANAAESVDARLVRYGFPPGHATATRRAATAAADAEAARRYRERWRDT